MTLGEQLKHLREGAGLSLEDLANITKIQLKYLNFLEKEEYDKLPAPVYIRGFIQKWAQTCGADPEPLLMHFYRENKLFVNRPNNTKITRPTSPRAIITTKHIIGFLLIISSSALIGYFYYYQRELASVPEIEIFSPTEVNIVTEDSNILLKGRAVNAKELFVNDNIAVLSVDGSFRYEYGLQTGVNSIIIRAISKDGKHVETIRKILKVE
jgi:transcriptional regulator with XRE-family HTH domain